VHDDPGVPAQRHQEADVMRERKRRGPLSQHGLRRLLDGLLSVKANDRVRHGSDVRQGYRRDLIILREAKELPRRADRPSAGEYAALRQRYMDEAPSHTPPVLGIALADDDFERQAQVANLAHQAHRLDRLVGVAEGSEGSGEFGELEGGGLGRLMWPRT
jgi:hypothetical protein